MKNTILKLISYIIRTTAEVIGWNLSGSNLNIKVYEDKIFKFKKYGFITKVLFINQHLVRFNKSFEYETLSLYSKLVKKGDTVLDIGANIGLFSLLGSDLVGDKGTIHAFEPNKETYQVLNENLKLNNIGNVFTHQLALSDKKEQVVLKTPSITKEEDADAYFHIQKSNGEDKNAMMTQTIDSFIESHSLKSVDVIKIDIEGAELLCLKGGEKLFGASNKPKIIFEGHEPFCKRYDYTIADLLSYLEQFDYKIENYETNQWVAIYEGVGSQNLNNVEKSNTLLKSE